MPSRCPQFHSLTSCYPLSLHKNTPKPKKKSCLLGEINEWDYRSSSRVAKMQNPHRKCSASCPFLFWSLLKPTKHWEFRSVFWSLLPAGGCPAHPEVIAGFQRKKLSVSVQCVVNQEYNMPVTECLPGITHQMNSISLQKRPLHLMPVGKSTVLVFCAIKLMNSRRYSTFSKPSPLG